MADKLISGECTREFSKVREAFEQNFSERNELGAAVAVYKDGRKVVDLWGGHKDLARTQPWESDTLVIMNSIAKSMTALSVHMLIDRGLVEFDAPVARYWPEFAQAGKEGVLVRHVLSHSCGVIFADAAKPGMWFDYPQYIKAIEVQAPAWVPGMSSAYNSVNIGFILGEIVRRVTGLTVGNFIRQEISDKLGVDYFIGMRPSEIARVSDMHPNPQNEFFKVLDNPDAPLTRAFRASPVGYFQNLTEIREREVPSFGGHGSARAMARIYAALANHGSLDGVTLLSPVSSQRLRWIASERACIMTGRFTRFGFGFMHNDQDNWPMGTNPGAYGHSGSGGALAWCDPDRNLSFAYVTNFQREGRGSGPRGSAVSIAAGA
jgi:CubicO group peptidase (beta-lactamase class C family)